MHIAINKCKSPNKEEHVVECLENLLAEIGGIESVVQPGQRVLIKPNFVVPAKGSGVTTNILVVKALIKEVLSIGGCQVVIGENVGVGYNTREIFAALGVVELAKELTVELVDLGATSTQKVVFPNHPVLKDLEISTEALNADVLINVPVMKTHMHTRVSLALKNLKGCLPHKSMKKMHIGGVEEGIPTLEHLIKPELNIIDATIAHEGMGPIHGQPKEMNCLLAATSALACDVAGCALMGVDPREIKHLYYYNAKYGGSLDLDDYHINKELVAELKSDFLMPPTDLRGAFGAHVVDRDTCSGCASAIIGALARLNINGDIDLVKDITLVVGQSVDSLDFQSKPVKMLIGSCMHKFKKQGDIYIPGCPPPDWDILGKIYRFHNIPLKEDFHENRLKLYEKL